MKIIFISTVVGIAVGVSSTYILMNTQIDELESQNTKASLQINKLNQDIRKLRNNDKRIAGIQANKRQLVLDNNPKSNVKNSSLSAQQRAILQKKRNQMSKEAIKKKDFEEREKIQVRTTDDGIVL